MRKKKVESEYMGLQVAADGGLKGMCVRRMNEGYRALGALKSVMSNKGLGIKPRSVYTKEQLYQRRCTEQRHGV